jgi:transposase
MEKIIKQCVGIDVSQDHLDVTFGVYRMDQSVELLESHKFKNHQQGFEKLLKWALKRTEEQIPLFFVMEATGVYYEKLACYLNEENQKVSVILPNRGAAYARSLTVKTVTDKEASRSLTQMGLEKKLPLWSKPEPLYHQLKKLSRERGQLQQAKTVFLNQIHAEGTGAWASKDSIARSKKRISMLEKQIKEIEKEIENLIKENPDLNRKVSCLTSIKGVGIVTAAAIIGETNGFSLFKNKRQLVSYAGYDVIRKDSGTSVMSKPRISKRGNRHIRKAMHFPALTSIRHDQENKNHYTRMIAKHGIKMKAAVAIQRKLLVLMFVLWRRETYFDPHFYWHDQNKIGQIALP